MYELAIGQPSHMLIEQKINVQNLDVEVVAALFQHYQSNVRFHLEGMFGHETIKNVLTLDSNR